MTVKLCHEVISVSVTLSSTAETQVKSCKVMTVKVCHKTTRFPVLPKSTETQVKSSQAKSWWWRDVTKPLGPLQYKSRVRVNVTLMAALLGHKPSHVKSCQWNTSRKVKWNYYSEEVSQNNLKFHSTRHTDSTAGTRKEQLQLALKLHVLYRFPQLHTQRRWRGRIIAMIGKYFPGQTVKIRTDTALIVSRPAVLWSEMIGKCFPGQTVQIRTNTALIVSRPAVLWSEPFETITL